MENFFHLIQACQNLINILVPIFKDLIFINAIFSSWLQQINSTGDDTLSALNNFQVPLLHISRSLSKLAWTLRTDECQCLTHDNLIHLLQNALKLDVPAIRAAARTITV